MRSSRDQAIGGKGHKVVTYRVTARGRCAAVAVRTPSSSSSSSSSCCATRTPERRGSFQVLRRSSRRGEPLLEVLATLPETERRLLLLASPVVIGIAPRRLSAAVAIVRHLLLRLSRLRRELCLHADFVLFVSATAALAVAGQIAHRFPFANVYRSTGGRRMPRKAMRTGLDVLAGVLCAAVVPRPNILHVNTDSPTSPRPYLKFLLSYQQRLPWHYQHARGNENPLARGTGNVTHFFCKLILLAKSWF